MKMKGLGIALLATCLAVLALTGTVGLRPVYAHTLLALTPSPEPVTPAPATSVPATSVPATTVPATSVPATSVPATSVPATEVRSTNTPQPSDNSRPKADVVITKQANVSEAVVGQVVDFTITVTNRGNGPAGNVVVIDNLPAFLELVNVTVSRGVLTINGREIRVTIGEVAAGETITIVVSARVIAVAVPPDDRNVAVLLTSSSSDNKDDNNASTEVRVQQPVLSPSPSPLPLAPTVTPVPTMPPPAVLPPTGSGDEPVSLWLVLMGIAAIALGLGLRQFYKVRKVSS